jgi:REP-associated tyrosine transposase
VNSFPYTGLYRYFLTFCAFERRRPFADAEVVSTTLEQFRKTAEEETFELLAYCFMPDHVHLLVEGTAEESDLRRFPKLAKQRAGVKHSRKFGGRLWQEGYYDRVLRDGEDIRDIARYLLNNPVRAGLVETPIDYPHLGSNRWTLLELIDGQR